MGLSETLLGKLRGLMAFHVTDPQTHAISKLRIKT